MKVSIAAEDKFCMTIEEAAAYFNIGRKRLVNFLDSPEGSELMLTVGVKRLVKRKKMEQYLNRLYSL